MGMARSTPPPDLDMRKLRYFVAVAEELNFGRAAQRLHIAQPVLSRQIRAFEREMGVDLLDRDSRGTTLTTAGSQLLADARFLLTEAKAMQDRLARVAEPITTLTVGVVPGLLATAAVREFEATATARRAEVVPLWWTDQVHAVHRGDAQVVYAREPFDPRGLGSMHLLDEPRDVLISSADPLAAKPVLHLQDLVNRRLLQDPGMVPEWYAIASPDMRRASAATHVSTVEEKLELVAGVEGFAILPRSTTRFYQRPDVRVIPIEGLGPSRVTLIWAADADDPVRDEFVRIALACADQTI
jgi:DNA-binding transcriptional LysR family regulator